MARKQVHDKESIIKSAIDFIDKKGYTNFSVRNVAKHMQASTQPIYSYFSNSKELYDNVIVDVGKLLLLNTEIKYTEFAFRNMGYGFTLFARDYPNLFTAFFNNPETNKEFIKAFLKALRAALDTDARFDKVSSEGKSLLLEKMWTFSYGYSFLIINGLVEDDSTETIKSMILDTGTAIIKDALMKEGLM